MKRILIVDDDYSFRVMLQTFLTKMEYVAELASNARECLKKIDKETFDLILIDFWLPDKSGLDLLKEIKTLIPHTPLILMTSYVDIKTAVKAIKSGAFEYVTKPLNTDEILITIRNALKTPSSPAGVRKSSENFTYIQGASPTSDLINQYIDLVAPTNISVIIQGESGTGKEYVSKMIHKKSQRDGKPFVAIDCGALSKDLAASELFGHMKGAFTGASQEKTGQFEEANGGTLFLDEIGNLSYDIQVKLLRALQERKIRKLGGNTDINIDVRVIVATNEDLTEAVKQKKFREDLFHRLNEFKIQVPPLREREHDVFIFAGHFLEQSNHELGKSVSGFDAGVKEKFKTYFWPGNLRELKNVIRRAVLLTPSGAVVKMDCIPQEITTATKTVAGALDKEEMVYDLKLMSEKNERELIEDTLNKVKFNKSKAAKLLNIDRKTLYNKMKVYGFDS